MFSFVIPFCHTTGIIIRKVGRSEEFINQHLKLDPVHAIDEQYVISVFYTYLDHKTWIIIAKYVGILFNSI